MAPAPSTGPTTYPTLKLTSSARMKPPSSHSPSPSTIKTAALILKTSLSPSLAPTTLRSSTAPLRPGRSPLPDNPGGTDNDPADATGTINFDDVDLSDTPIASITFTSSVSGTPPLSRALKKRHYSTISLSLRSPITPMAPAPSTGPTTYPTLKLTSSARMKPPSSHSPSPSTIKTAALILKTSLSPSLAPMINPSLAPSPSTPQKTAAPSPLPSPKPTPTPQIHTPSPSPALPQKAP